MGDQKPIGFFLENCPYPEHGIVEIKSYDRTENEELTQFYYLHRTSSVMKKSDTLNYSLAHMFESLQVSLDNWNKKHVFL